MRHSRARSGLSLIELVVVVVIIGVLATLAMPFSGKATEQVRDAVARANLRTVLLAELEYYEKHGKYTADRTELTAFAPGLPMGSYGKPGSIYIVTGVSRTNPAVCLFTEAATGWYTLYNSTRSGGTLELGGPNDCTRKILEEQGENPEDAGRGVEHEVVDSVGTVVIGGSKKN